MVGVLTFFLGLTMSLPVVTDIYCHEGNLSAGLLAMGISLAAGALMFLCCRQEATDHISQREGMAIVTLGWSSAALFGALPFYLSGEIPYFTDAFFESISGLTTTGASILTDIEALSKGLHLWRCFIQWVGGMGIIVLGLAILPLLGVGGMQLYKAEVPSPSPDKLKPRIRDTAALLWKVYALISGLELMVLLLGDMTFFDALCHAFTTMPTGGFSTKAASIAHYNSVFIDFAIVFFMLLAGINFSLHYQMLRGKPLAFWRDAECRFFLLVVLALVVVVSWDIFGNAYTRVGEALRYGAFQVVSIVTTTGFATADYEQWPVLSQIILLLCMFMGASAGSTGGGVKCLRVMLGFKYCYRELFSLVHPRAVSPIKINGQAVPEETIRSIMGFLALFVGMFALCAVLLAATGVDFLTAFGAVAACIGNIGPGFGMVGPVENYALIPVAGKWLLIWCMLLGRLEVFTVIIFLVPEFYRK
jgi:trk system potassium uptake protein TrkH